MWSHGNARPEGNFSATEILADLDLRVVRSLAHTRMLTIVFAMPLNAVAFRAKIDFFWDKSGTQAIDRDLMNHLGRVGSDTGIRTRVSAVRGRRPRPLDDIANVEQKLLGAILYALFSHEGREVASGSPGSLIRFSHCPWIEASSLQTSHQGIRALTTGTSQRA